MMNEKYFQKLKCDHSQHCKDGSGIIAGADITSTIKPILEGIDNKEDLWMEYWEERTKGKGISFGYGSKNTEKRSFLKGLQKAQQIIEENIIRLRIKMECGHYQMECGHYQCFFCLGCHVCDKKECPDIPLPVEWWKY